MEIQEGYKTFPQLHSDEESPAIPPHTHTHFMEFEAEIVLGSRGRKPPWSCGKALLEHLLHQLRVVGHITPACPP